MQILKVSDFTLKKSIMPGSRWYFITKKQGIKYKSIAEEIIAYKFTDEEINVK